MTKESIVKSKKRKKPRQWKSSLETVDKSKYFFKHVAFEEPIDLIKPTFVDEKYNAIIPQIRNNIDAFEDMFGYLELNGSIYGAWIDEIKHTIFQAERIMEDMRDEKGNLYIDTYENNLELLYEIGEDFLELATSSSFPIHHFQSKNKSFEKVVESIIIKFDQESELIKKSIIYLYDIFIRSR